tara:strand:+ start:91 stop:315 length:225 start_codon:yes stop_codon:yes gene_type:complete
MDYLGEHMTNWFKIMTNNQNPFDEIRIMTKNELRAYIREHRSVQKIIMSGNYTEEQRMLSSKVVYAKNRLKLAQ